MEQLAAAKSDARAAAPQQQLSWQQLEQKWFPRCEHWSSRSKGEAKLALQDCKKVVAVVEEIQTAEQQKQQFPVPSSAHESYKGPILEAWLELHRLLEPHRRQRRQTDWACLSYTITFHMGLYKPQSSWQKVWPYVGDVYITLIGEDTSATHPAQEIALSWPASRRRAVACGHLQCGRDSNQPCKAWQDILEQTFSFRARDVGRITGSRIRLPPPCSPVMAGRTVKADYGSLWPLQHATLTNMKTGAVQDFPAGEAFKHVEYPTKRLLRGRPTELLPYKMQPYVYVVAGTSAVSMGPEKEMHAYTISFEVAPDTERPAHAQPNYVGDICVALRQANRYTVEAPAVWITGPCSDASVVNKEWPWGSRRVLSFESPIELPKLAIDGLRIRLVATSTNNGSALQLAAGSSVKVTCSRTRRQLHLWPKEKQLFEPGMPGAWLYTALYPYTITLTLAPAMSDGKPPFVGDIQVTLKARDSFCVEVPAPPCTPDGGGAGQASTVWAPGTTHMLHFKSPVKLPLHAEGLKIRLVATDATRGTALCLASKKGAVTIKCLSTNRQLRFQPMSPQAGPHALSQVLQPGVYGVWLYENWHPYSLSLQMGPDSLHSLPGRGNRLDYIGQVRIQLADSRGFKVEVPTPWDHNQLWKAGSAPVTITFQSPVQWPPKRKGVVVILPKTNVNIGTLWKLSPDIGSVKLINEARRPLRWRKQQCLYWPVNILEPNVREVLSELEPPVLFPLVNGVPLWARGATPIGRIMFVAGMCTAHMPTVLLGSGLCGFGCLVEAVLGWNVDQLLKHATPAKEVLGLAPG